MTPGYPLLLDLTGRRVLVVGAGAVGRRRALALAAAGAIVTVVAPDAGAFATELESGEIEVGAPESGAPGDSDDAAVRGRIAVQSRAYQVSDLAGVWLVHACAGSTVDAAVSDDAERAGVWCVRSSSAAQSRAWTPAVARSGDVVVAVSAAGDPGRAVAIRDAVRLLLDTGELPTRPLRNKGDAGRVALVGGGPGDPGLITVRGRRLLAEADVVVVDRLGPRALLGQLAPGVEVIEAGKAPDNHTLPQAAINALLVSLARQGKRVVRLKGGDPFVFGRGAEEMLACVEAGIPCEVVPGVTSAIAVPAMAGVPVTHRHLARQFTVVTGHEDLDWGKLAAVEGTLVVLMGATRVARIAKELVAAGSDPNTPVAVVENGTTHAQRTTRGTLGSIGDQVAAAGVTPPAVIVIGDVARMHDLIGGGAS